MSHWCKNGCWPPLQLLVNNINKIIALLFDDLQLCQMEQHCEEYDNMAEAEKTLFSVNMPIFSYNETIGRINTVKCASLQKKSGYACPKCAASGQILYGSLNSATSIAACQI